MHKNVVSIAKHVVGDLLNFVAPEFAEVFRSRKNFKTAEKSVERLTLTKQVDDGSYKKRIIPPETTKYDRWSFRDLFTFTWKKSIEVILGINLSLQFLRNWD